MSACDTDEGDDMNSIDMTGKIMIAQWNIGHFSGGMSANSAITADEYESKKIEYQSFLSSIPADIISINEYSRTFAFDKSGKELFADDLLFGKYPYCYIGGTNNMVCNDIFSKIELGDSKIINYTCNESAQITHNPNLHATDYYLIESNVIINDIPTTLVSTHLAFDMNNEAVSRNQIEEIINRYRDEDNVILCGDWNAFDVSSFDLFKQAGYQVANHGEFGDFLTWSYSALDNIVVKGFNIYRVYLRRTPLSDHNMIIAVLTYE